MDPAGTGRAACAQGVAGGDAAAKGLASDSQGLFAFQRVHTANTGKTKLARHTR